MLERIKACIKMAESKQPQIRDWWLVIDQQDLAQNISEAITFTNIHHAYDEAFRESNAHSMTGDATGQFGHLKMSGSIMDWMVLHESSAAIITSGSTAYGNSGAKGSGKVLMKDEMCNYNFYARPSTE